MSSGTSASRTERADEFEQALVRPVQVLEHQQGRLLAGKRLEESLSGGEQVLSVIDGVLGEAREDR